MRTSRGKLQDHCGPRPQRGGYQLSGVEGEGRKWEEGGGEEERKEMERGWEGREEIAFKQRDKMYCMMTSHDHQVTTVRIT